MALLFMDSFDHYVTADLARKWNSTANTPTIQAAGRRAGSGCLRISASQMVATKAVVGSGALIVGFAFKASSYLGWIMSIVQGSNAQFILSATSGGMLQAYRGPHGGPTLLGTATGGQLSTFGYSYIEMKVTIHDSTGTVVIRVNGQEVLNLTGQDTAFLTPVGSGWDAIQLYSSQNVTYDYDDLYVCDTSGSAPWNDFLGDIRVDAVYPTGASANGAPNTQWTPSAGANYTCVDETAPNDDTDSTSASTNGLIDTFVVGDLPSTGATIKGVQHCLAMKKSDAGTCTVAPVIRHSGVDYPGANLNPGTGYVYGLQIATLNPGTSAAWTEAGFNGAEFGYKKDGLMALPVRVNSTVLATWSGGTATTYASTAIAHTTGNALVVIVGGLASGGESVTGIVDLAGNAFTKVDHAFEAGDKYREEIWYAKNITGHASNVVTATWSAAVGYRAIVVLQYSGLDKVAPFNASAQGTAAAASTTVVTGTLTPTKPDEVHVVISRWGLPGTLTYPAGFAEISADANVHVGEKFVSGVPSAGTVTLTHTTTSFGKLALVAVFVVTSSTKWRLNINDSNHATYVTVAELKMSATLGGTNLCTGGTATALATASGSPADAFDGNPATEWTGYISGGTWLQYEFASAVVIVGYTVQCTSAWPAKGWTLEYWDGSAWQVTDTVVSQTAWWNQEIRSFPLFSRMKWRISITAAESTPYGGFGEIQLRTVAGGANQATVALQASAIGGAPADALDGNPATYWQNNTPSQWMYWFQAPTDVVEYLLQASTPYPMWGPKTWTLEYWNAVRSEWVVADIRTNQANWTANESRTFSVPVPTIALDAVNTGGSGSWTHVCGNMASVLMVATNSGATSAVTYNGVALTLVGSIVITGGISGQTPLKLWTLMSPASGSHTVVLTGGGFGCSVSYSGAGVIGGSPLDGSAVTNSSPGSASSLTTSIPTTLDRDWIVVAAIGYAFGNGAIDSASTVVRVKGQSYTAIYDTNGPRTPEGLQEVTTVISTNAGEKIFHIVIALRPLGPEPAVATSLTQDVVEVLSEPVPIPRVTQDVIEVLSEPIVESRVSLLVAELISYATVAGVVSQVVVETLTSSSLLAPPTTTVGVFMGDVAGSIWVE